MTALADALEAAGHLPPMPGLHKKPDRTDPQLSMHYWNHACPTPTCITWVPNHRRGCARHEETS